MIGLPPSAPGHWASPVYSLPATGNDIKISAHHGRGIPPRQVRWVLVCQQTDNGYATGDEVDVVGGYNNGVQPTLTNTGAVCNIVIMASLAALSYPPRSGGATQALTNTQRNWGLKLYAAW